jgi:LemA protein
MKDHDNGIRRGDKVQLMSCPSYPSLETHTARVTSDPVKVKGGGYAVSVRYTCITLKTAIVGTDKMIVIRSASNMKLSKPAITTGIVLLALFITGAWLAGNYNSLVTASNAVDNSKAKIDTQLERRYELVDNIVASVDGSQAQESEVFGKIAEARKLGGNATSAGEEANANAQIDTQIALLPRLQEAYPELRSNDQVTRLITELQGTAGQVATARDTYNDTVTNYNNNITQFPKSVFATVFNFDKKELFKASSAAEKNPQVKLKSAE